MFTYFTIKKEIDILEVVEISQLLVGVTFGNDLKRLNFKEGSC